MALILVVLTGCTTLNSDGDRVFDPVKTEKVKAIIKPQVSTLVALVVNNNPGTREHFQLAADQICLLRDSGQVTPATFQVAINSAFANWDGSNRLEVIAGVNVLIALVEINYADRLRADLPPEKFAWNLFDVLCEGIKQALEQAPPSE